MIFGKKNPHIEEQKKINDATVYNWFAWRPMHLQDGRWVWWQPIWREYWSSRCNCGHNYYLSKNHIKEE